MSILKIKDQNNNWQSIPAMKGDPGVSPAVTVETIQGGHQVTITDATHPQGQSFNVMDGVDAVDAKIGQSVSLTFTYDDNTTQTYNLLTAPSNNS